jgi:hypothetical protein
MNLNFKEALALLSQSLPLVLLRSGFYVAGGFMVILLFAMLLVVVRLANGVTPAQVTVMALLLIGGGWITGLTLERFFLYRYQAALLCLFSRHPGTAPGLAAALREASRSYPGPASWATQKGRLRRFLAMVHRDREGFLLPPGDRGQALGPLASGPLGQAVMVLAFARGGDNVGQAVREGLALCLRHGTTSRVAARSWGRFSTTGLALIFLCLALPNWIIFRSAGVPVWIGIALAAAIAWLLHQAFIVPLALAGVSAVLLAETRDRIPDPELYGKLAALFPAAAPPGVR